MTKWRCKPCGFTYDESKGMPEAKIAPGTKFKDLPTDWMCPICGATKDFFEESGVR
jgi:rubredoxin